MAPAVSLFDLHSHHSTTYAEEALDLPVAISNPIALAASPVSSLQEAASLLVSTAAAAAVEEQQHHLKKYLNQNLNYVAAAAPKEADTYPYLVSSLLVRSHVMVVVEEYDATAHMDASEAAAAANETWKNLHAANAILMKLVDVNATPMKTDAANATWKQTDVANLTLRVANEDAAAWNVAAAEADILDAMASDSNAD